MRTRKLHIYTSIVGLGFIAVIVMEILLYMQFSDMDDHHETARISYERYITQVDASGLAAMAEHLEQHYPVLRDTARLKQEAGTDWFWDIADEWHGIAETFKFKYIYYIEKTAAGYVFLMSSGIRRDEHPEWLRRPVWTEDPPAFYDEAWETKQTGATLEPYLDEWGMAITAVRPILVDGVVIGLLGIDRDVSFMADLVREGRLLQEHGGAVLQRQRNTLIASSVIAVIIVAMSFHILLLKTSLVVTREKAEADAHVRGMLDAIPTVCTIWGMDGSVLDCNRAAPILFGLESKSEYLESFYALHPPYQPDGEDSRSGIMRHFKEAFETGYRRVEWMHQTAAGEALPTEVTMVRIPWTDGYRMACYTRDLRDYKGQEAIALELKHRLAGMLDSMPIASFFFDPAGALVDCNQQAVNLFGCAGKAEFLEKFFDLSPERQPDGSLSREESVKRILGAFDAGKSKFRWEHLKADGSPLSMEVTLVRLEWKGGYRLAAYAHDLNSSWNREAT